MNEQLIYKDEGVVVGEIGNICVAIWREAVTRPRFRHQSASLSSVVKRAPGSCAFLCIVEQACRPPEEEMRRASGEMIKGLVPSLPVVACVIEGDGFRAAVTRSVLAGMVLVAGSRLIKYNFSSTVPEACAWLDGVSKLAPSPALSAAIERLRAQMPVASFQRAVRS